MRGQPLRSFLRSPGATNRLIYCLMIMILNRECLLAVGNSLSVKGSSSSSGGSSGFVLVIGVYARSI